MRLLKVNLRGLLFTFIFGAQRHVFSVRSAERNPPHVYSARSTERFLHVFSARSAEVLLHVFRRVAPKSFLHVFFGAWRRTIVLHVLSAGRLFTFFRA